MKKIALILTLCVLGLASEQLVAQNFRLGLKAAPSLAWIKSETDQYNSEGVRFGFSYGLLSEFILAEQYSFDTGIHITYFGGKLSYPIDDVDDPAVTRPYLERTYKLQNIEIPLTLKMKTREIGYNTYFARFGFAGSANLTARADDLYYNPTTNDTSSETDVDIKSEIPLFRVSMILGLGFEHSLGGTTSLVVGMNFNNGFTSILKGKDWQNLRNQQARANYIELSVGVLF